VPEDPARIAETAGDSDFPFTLNPSSWPPHPNRLWVNRGDGTFEDRAEAAGVRGESGRSLSASWADLDEDGLPDLYVANDVSDNALWLNNGDGTFRDASYEAVVADYRGAMGLAVGDWDGDLDLDLFITHWIAQENALYSSQLAEGRAAGDDVGLIFVDESDRVGLGQIALDLIGWGTSFADLDLDGRPDLFVANGSTFQDRSARETLIPMDPHLYWNRGPEEGFFEVSADAGLRTVPPGVGRGSAFADYDGDGDLDLVIARRGGKARLLRNDSRTGNGITLRLRGTTLHASAVGARVVARAGDAAHLREVGAGSSYLSQDAPDLVIGLGAHERVDELEVRWPGGATETWTDLEAGRVWEIVEGEEPRALELAAAPAAALPEEPAGPGMSRDDIRAFWKIKREADRAQLEQRWEDAAGAFAGALELDPRHEDSLYSRGNCLLELGRYAEAKESWEALLAVNPRSSRAWVQIGMLQSLPDAGELWNPAAAARALDEAHRINPEESGPLIRAGEARLAAGDLKGAEETLTAAWSMNDMATSALFLSGYLAWKRGDEAAAAQLLERAAGSLEEVLPSAAASSEGDTRSEDMAEIRQRAAERRLFASCVDGLRRHGATAAPERLYAPVDEYLAALPRPAGGAPADQSR
jgi:tetratricopeptide (TPR) repeat protein